MVKRWSEILCKSLFYSPHFQALLQRYLRPQPECNPRLHVSFLRKLLRLQYPHLFCVMYGNERKVRLELLLIKCLCQ